MSHQLRIRVFDLCCGGSRSVLLPSAPSAEAMVDSLERVQIGGGASRNARGRPRKNGQFFGMAAATQPVRAVGPSPTPREDTQ